MDIEQAKAKTAEVEKALNDILGNTPEIHGFGVIIDWSPEHSKTLAEGGVPSFLLIARDGVSGAAEYTKHIAQCCINIGTTLLVRTMSYLSEKLAAVTSAISK